MNACETYQFLINSVQDYQNKELREFIIEDFEGNRVDLKDCWHITQLINFCAVYNGNRDFSGDIDKWHRDRQEKLEKYLQVHLKEIEKNSFKLV